MYTIEIIARKLPVKESHLVQNSPIEQILTDSRSLTQSKATLFVAIRTTTGDGHKYIAPLYQRGVRNFLVDTLPARLEEDYADANFISVHNTLSALQILASAWRKEFDIPVIGITGSNGKTVVKEFLYQLLGGLYTTVRSPRSYNSQLGVPLSVLKMRESDELAIFEAGISQPGEMNHLERIIAPTLGVFTNIGTAHQERFSSIAQKIEEKLRLFVHCDQLVYNSDDERLVQGIERLGLAQRSFRWSWHDSSAPLWVELVEQTTACTTLHYHYKQPQGGLQEGVVQIPFSDKASIENAAHCIAVIFLLAPDKMEACKPLFASLEPVEMRLEIKEGDRNNYIINDSYNNDINSLQIALDYQQRRASQDKLQTVLILSDILQSSIMPHELYSRVAAMVQEHRCSLVLGVGKEISSNQHCFDHLPARFYQTTEELLEHEQWSNLSRCCILIKGARAFAFEKVAKLLSKQVHETVLEIDLAAIRENLHRYRALLPTEVKFVAMIKANAYGMGAVEVAKILDQEHIDVVAVAVADEGKELRQNGIGLPIMVMNPEEEAFETIIHHRLEPEIYSFSLLEKFAARVDKEGLFDYPIHIKLDTGMHRLGFMPHETDQLARLLSAHPCLKVRSVFTHLAAADDPTKDAFTKQQLQCFQEMATRLQEGWGYPVLMHALNTAGIERFPEYHFQMVRLGIGLYGISPTQLHGIKPVPTLRTTLLQVKELPAGESVGYGNTFVLPQPTRIGIIPIGYADGYDRSMGRSTTDENHRPGMVLAGGVLCPILGKVCMDTSIIDLSQSTAQEGDVVTVLGGEALPWEEVADQMGTIAYELFTRLSPRVRRIYYRD